MGHAAVAKKMFAREADVIIFKGFIATSTTLYLNVSLLLIQ